MREGKEGRRGHVIKRLLKKVTEGEGVKEGRKGGKEEERKGKGFHSLTQMRKTNKKKRGGRATLKSHTRIPHTLTHRNKYPQTNNKSFVPLTQSDDERVFCEFARVVELKVSGWGKEREGEKR